MYRYGVYVVAALASLLATGSSQAIQKVAPRLEFIDFGGGWTLPTGEYDGTVIGDFTLDGYRYDVDADKVYDEGFHFKFGVGRVQRGHLQTAIGFAYTRHDIRNPIVVRRGDEVVTFSWTYGGTTLVRDLAHNQYDLVLNVNWLINDMQYQTWSPFVGLGFQAGLSGVSGEDVETEWDGNVALSLNFGVEIGLWAQRGGETFVSLVSDNSWNFVSSSDRPRYLQLGGLLRYYFKS